MFIMYASNSHSYTHLILALGIVREPTVWVFITSKYPGIHDIGLAILSVAGYPYLERRCDDGEQVLTRDDSPHTVLERR